jgi:hypothetical protein
MKRLQNPVAEPTCFYPAECAQDALKFCRKEEFRDLACTMTSDESCNVERKIPD